MDVITELTTLNFSTIIIGIFIILSAIIAVYEMVGKISVIIGKPIKKYKQREEDHRLVMENAKTIKQLTEDHKESVKQSIRHDEMIKNDLLSLTDTVNGIANTLEKMQENNNETKLKELKDSLIRYYNKYKTIGEWSKLEKDAFWDLFEDYEKRGGDGYIHSIVEPVMRELREIDL